MDCKQPPAAQKGMYVVVGNDIEDSECRKIVDFGSIIIDQPLGKHHGTGSLVRIYPAGEPPIIDYPYSNNNNNSNLVTENVELRRQINLLQKDLNDANITFVVNKHQHQTSQPHLGIKDSNISEEVNQLQQRINELEDALSKQPTGTIL